MTIKQLEKCILPFQKFNYNEKGIGLGLSITNNIMKLMGGIMRIDSILNQGTTIELIFPDKN